MIYDAQPNAAHRTLAEFTNRKAEFLALTMNVDDLNERAGHPADRLYHLHGSAFDVACMRCTFRVSGQDAEDAIQNLLQRDSSLSLQREDIPHCPEPGCDGLFRPGIVWFTESIPQPLMKSIYNFINGPIDESKTIDIMLVVGTSALVYPATAYIEAARRKGARVAVVDTEKEDPSLLGLEEQDWYF